MGPIEFLVLLSILDELSGNITTHEISSSHHIKWRGSFPTFSPQVSYFLCSPPMYFISEKEAQPPVRQHEYGPKFSLSEKEKPNRRSNLTIGIPCSSSVVASCVVAPVCRFESTDPQNSTFPEAQSDVHLRGRDVSNKHITTHSGSAQDCFSERFCFVSDLNHGDETPNVNSRPRLSNSETAVIAGESSPRSKRRKRKGINENSNLADARVTHVAKANNPSSNR